MSDIETCGYCDGLGGGEWCSDHLSGNCPCAKDTKCVACDGRGHFVLCRQCDSDDADEATRLCSACVEPVKCHICSRPAAEYRITGGSIYKGAGICGFCHRNLAWYCTVRPVRGAA